MRRRRRGSGARLGERRWQVSGRGGHSPRRSTASTTLRRDDTPQPPASAGDDLGGWLPPASSAATSCRPQPLDACSSGARARRRGRSETGQPADPPAAEGCAVSAAPALTVWMCRLAPGDPMEAKLPGVFHPHLLRLWHERAHPASLLTSRTRCQCPPCRLSTCDSAGGTYGWGMVWEPKDNGHGRSYLQTARAESLRQCREGSRRRRLSFAFESRSS